MKSIKNKVNNEIIINKSRFITHIIPINNIEEISKEIEKIKKIYKDATHYCFAYILNSKEKCSDDGEPSGTAGMPILNVLKNNNLNNILCIVIRYFGGIKLGSGGLIRAYSSSTSKALNKCIIGNITDGYKITLELDYNNVKKIDYILKEKVITKEFKNKIKYTFDIQVEEFEIIKDNLLKYSSITDKQKIIMIKDGD